MLPFQFSDTSDTLMRYVDGAREAGGVAQGRKTRPRAGTEGSRGTRPRRAGLRTRLCPRRTAPSSAAIDARAELRPLNKLLLQSEQKLGNGDGLPRRDWFKHQIYAPGFYTGYGVKTMPQIREGLEEQRLDEARDGVRKVAAAVNALAAQVQEAATLLQKVTR